MNERDHRREADTEVPERIWRVSMHYHDLIYIKAYWESIGQQVPSSFGEELARTHNRLMAILDDERNQGGAYYKEKEHEARQSESVESSEPQSGAESTGDPSGRSGTDRDRHRPKGTSAVVRRSRV